MAPKCEPPCHFNDRLYFTNFPQPHPRPTPSTDRLQKGDLPPPFARGQTTFGFPVTPDEDATYYYFTIDHPLLYLYLFQRLGTPQPHDAGRGSSDCNLSIQDCLWGMWKAMQNGLCDMNEFNVDDYEYFEKVENGDWNWITPSFIAFAGPVEHAWTKKMSPTSARKLPTSFQSCLDYFEGHGVKLVVRLNNVLYDRQHFIDHGTRHEEMYFDDGTNPTDEIVRKFINLADEVVEAGGAIAIHVRLQRKIWHHVH
ncbi:hypothetical protein DFH11DRAFT_1588285 [Phellopilus nigrolimitatus]|nr:hypothetical protein DFH11DRAFT_1588285 [Phellopilus nigrolimitatus]